MLKTEKKKKQSSITEPALLAAKGGKLPSDPVQPPATAAEGEGAKSFQIGNRTIELSARELKICAETKRYNLRKFALKLRIDAGGSATGRPITN